MKLYKCVCGRKIKITRKNKTSKFIRLYGKTIDSLAKDLNINRGTVFLWHKKGKLAEMLKK